ncbi:MAG TPA: alkaline phosphatase family protein, partial [Gemmatimonadaceae bacterium]|nr:alkaline phosphatase family protein [Gemmatimonadaceae bacterium]
AEARDTTVRVHAADSPKRKKVLVIGLDGVRVDVMRRLRLPNIEALAANGVLTDAQARMPTVSGPGWSSILTGVWSDKHGVKDNSFVGKNYGAYPDFLTRLERADSTWSTFAALDWPPLGSALGGGPLVSDSVDVKVLFNGDRLGYREADARAVAAAAYFLAHEDPDAAFVYIGNTDEIAHQVGPLTPQFRAALEEADRHVGRLVEAIRGRPTYAREDWLILMSTDHGHRDAGGHGGDSPVELTSFFLASGPSVARGQPIAHADIVDVAVTALAHLGVAIDPAWHLDGKVDALAGRR